MIGPFSRDKLTTETVIHSHVLEEIPQDFTPVLSTRKDKRDIILSNLIARKTEDWVPGESPNIIKPFSVDIDYYLALSKQLILKEQQYIERNNPIIVYLEDSVDSIEEKLNISAIRAADRTTVSKHPPAAYIINYTECLNAYAEQFAQ